MGHDIAWLDGGNSHVGTDRPEIRADGEHPKRLGTLKPFGMSKHAVTVGVFTRFVAATGRQTDAERFGWSYVFRV